MKAAELVLAFVFGIAVGSFANVAVYRVPLGLSVVSPRSACPGCGATLAWYDNVPLLSFVALRGRCRTCGRPISLRYPLVEVAVGAVWVGMLQRIGIHPELPAFLAFGTTLVILSAIDLEHHRLPDKVLGPAAVVAIVLLAPAAGIGRRWVPLEHAALGALSSLRPLSPARQAGPGGLVGPVGHRGRGRGDDPADP